MIVDIHVYTSIFSRPVMVGIVYIFFHQMQVSILYDQQQTSSQ